jgi:hypothetical protein
LLQTILPEITVKIRKELSGDSSDVSGFNHILAAYSDLEKRLLDSSASPITQIDSDKHSSTTNQLGLLKFALLLKNIKMPTPSNLEKRHSLSNGPIDPICRRLKLSNHEKNYIEFIIQNHQKLLSLFTSFQNGRLSDTAVTRLFMLSGNQLPDLVLYAQSIVNSGTDNTAELKKNFSIFTQVLLNRYYNVFIPISEAPPLITG